MEGKENFKKGETYVIVYNHNALIDVPLSAPFVPGGNKTIAKSSFAKLPIFGWFYKRGSVLVDRKNDMIISGGENIYPAEIENVLFAIDGVKEAAVIGVPDEIWGESVHAIIVLNDGAKLDRDKVIEFCQTRIAKYKCPKSVEFRSSSLPLNPTGKVLKRELRDSYHAQSEAGV